MSGVHAIEEENMHIQGLSSGAECSQMPFFTDPKSCVQEHDVKELVFNKIHVELEKPAKMVTMGPN